MSKVKIPAALSKGVEMLALHLRAESVKFHREYRFHPTRKWRFDFVIPGKSLAVEVDGGNRMAAIHPRTGKPIAIGRHTKDADYDKLNEAAILGWRVMRFSPGQVKRGEAIATILRALR